MDFWIRLNKEGSGWQQFFLKGQTGPATSPYKTSTLQELDGDMPNTQKCLVQNSRVQGMEKR